MKVRVVASTKSGHGMSKEDAMFFSGRASGICYLPNSVDTLKEEDARHTMKRAEMNLKMGHHSVFGHVTYNLVIENAPKILAIILNNEKVYNTSERSARYTKIETSGREKELYEKWIRIFRWETKKIYNLPERQLQKLAQENARYMISIFTPSTTMMYSTDFRQLNYIIYWFRDYIENAEDTPFSKKLKPVMQEFVDQLSNLEVKGLNPEMKGRGLSIFATRNRKEEFGENYCTTYEASFAELAQAQRHRTISYEFMFENKENVKPELNCFGTLRYVETFEPDFYVPEIIRYRSLGTEWYKDIYSLADEFPQGMLVKVNERGTIENFVQKCTERLCGNAQLEIMDQTLDTLDKYVEAVRDNPELSKYLEPYTYGPRCTFPNWKCCSQCFWGPDMALTRDV